MRLSKIIRKSFYVPKYRGFLSDEHYYNPLASGDYWVTEIYKVSLGVKKLLHRYAKKNQFGKYTFYKGKID